MSRVSPHEMEPLAISGRAVEAVAGFALAVAGVEAPVPTSVGLASIIAGVLVAAHAIFRPSGPEQPR